MRYYTHPIVLLIAFTCITRAEDSQQQQLIRVNKPHQQQQEQGQERTKVVGNIQREAQNNNNNKNRNDDDAEAQIVFINTLQTEDKSETFTSKRILDMIRPQNYIVQNVAQEQIEVTQNKGKEANSKPESNEFTTPLPTMRTPIEQLRTIEEQKALYNKLNAEHQRLIETNQTLEHFHDNFTLAKNEFISWATAYLIQFLPLAIPL